MRTLAAIAVLALSAAGCAGSASVQSDSTFAVTMRDNHFDPDSFTVEEGETVTFRFVNRGSVEHDAFIGKKAEQKDHRDEMREAEEDAHGGHSGADEAAVTVGPGDSETLQYTFAERGTVLIGCHQPGHYEDGMTAEVEVT